METKTWHVDVFLEEEDDDRTSARAVLRSNALIPLEGHGSARRNPVDPRVPEIGDEIATARALASLASELVEAAARDVETSVHRPAKVNL